jgi:hypothetical protein
MMSLIEHNQIDDQSGLVLTLQNGPLMKKVLLQPETAERERR